MARFVDPTPLAQPHLVDGAAPGTIDAGQTKNMHRLVMPLPQFEPATFRLDAPPAALGRGAKGRGFIDKRAAGIAIHAGRRQIADPAQASRCGDQ